MGIEFRRARPEDVDRIREISATNWDGNDYIGSVIVDWLADPDGEVTVAVDGGRLLGFGRRRWLAPAHAWLEGLRVDPADRGRGVGRALTCRLVDRAVAEGAQWVGLSTYIDNEASIHIIESSGFRRIASFVQLESEGPVPPGGDRRIVDVPREAAAAFIAGSDSLVASAGLVSRGWTFPPFSLGVSTAFGDGASFRGIQQNGRLRALIVRADGRADGHPNIQFFGGGPQEAVDLLLDARRSAGDRTVESMAPAPLSADAIAAWTAAGFAPWRDFEPDVFVYTLGPTADPRNGAGDD